MKRILLSLFFILCTTISFAYDVVVNGIYYNLVDGNAEVTSGDQKYSGAVIIPSKITVSETEYPVTIIGRSAFRYCSSLTSLVIPNSVTSIGIDAFYGCSALTSVTIPNSVTSIGEDAFYWCSGLTSLIVDENNPSYSSVENVLFNKEKTELICCAGGKKDEYSIPNSVVTIGNYAFEYCSGLTSVTIPNSVISIGDDAFSGCSGLTSVNIPNSVTSIGEYAFYRCSGLTSVNIGNSVTSIGENAFYGCSGLTSVNIGNSVTSIGKDAFYGCYGLTSVNISDLSAWCKIQFKNNEENPLFFAHKLLLNGEEIKDLVIPDNVTNIGDYAFYNCSGLTSVTISNSVTSIGNYAFYKCSGLTSVNIGNSVTSIGSYAFFKCSGLTSVNIPNSVTRIGYVAFRDCSSLTSVTIPNSVTSIGTNAFYSVTNIVYTGTATGSPWGAKSVNGFVEGYLVYKDDTKTELVGCSSAATGDFTIPNSVTSIGSSAFYYCSGLTSVTIPNSVTSIGNYAFAFTNLEKVTCFATDVPSTASSVFDGANVNNAVLYVPEASLNKYKTTSPWSEFGKYACVGDCAKPTISYENGKLIYTSETEGAQIVSEVKSDDIKTSYDNEVPLTATYNITAYATKSGYYDSETATATLVWLDVDLEESSTDAEKITVSVKPLLITQDAGIVTISGLQNDEQVSAFDVSGKQIATSRAIGAETMIDLSSQQGKAAIIKVSGKSVKVMIK